VQAHPKTRVVYHSTDQSTGDVDLKIVNTDGTQRRTLVGGQGDDYFCADLEDRIIYATVTSINGQRNATICSIKKTGSDKIELATDPGYAWYLGVAGERMIYATSFNTDNFGNLYSVKLNGEDKQELATGVYFHAIVEDRLIYSVQSSSRDIHAVGVDGSFRTVLANSSSDEMYLGRSGHRIIFSVQDSQPNNIYSVDDTGQPNPVKILNTSQHVIYAGVGPRGRVYFQVEYPYGSGVEADIWSCNGDGSDRIVLTTSREDERALEAVGDRVVFVENTGTQQTGLFSMPWYGGPRVSLTPNPPEYFHDYVGSVGGYAIIRDGLASKYKLYSIPLSGGNFARLTDDWFYRPNSEGYHLDSISNTVILKEMLMGGHALFSARPDGQQTYQLTPTIWAPRYQCTSSNRFVFAAGKFGERNLYSVGATGGPLTLLDGVPGFDAFKAIPVADDPEHHHGYLSQWQFHFRPAPYYYVSGGYTHTAKLSGPSGADFDLYLHKWDAGFWRRVAFSTSSNSSESITYSGAAGYYRWEVYAYSGSGFYDLWFTRP
jgi:hypothetical protein